MPASARPDPGTQGGDPGTLGGDPGSLGGDPGTRRSRRGVTSRGFTGLPGWIWVPAGLGALFVVVPLVGILARVDWADFLPLVASESALAALRLSLGTAAASTAVVLLLGVPMAMALARGTLPGLRVLRALVLLPLVLPPVVGGLALLYTFGRFGLVGRWLDVLGVQLAFSTAAVVMAQAFVSLPFLVVSLEGALRTAGGRYEAVAATLGASPTHAFRRVTLPLVLPGLASGLVLAFARSLGEFGATLTFAGSLQGVTRTLPLEVYLQREADPNAAVALALVLVAVAAAVVGLAYGRRAQGFGAGGVR